MDLKLEFALTQLENLVYANRSDAATIKISGGREVELNQMVKNVRRVILDGLNPNRLTRNYGIRAEAESLMVVYYQEIHEYRNAQVKRSSKGNFTFKEEKDGEKNERSY